MVKSCRPVNPIFVHLRDFLNVFCSFSMISVHIYLLSLVGGFVTPQIFLKVEVVSITHRVHFKADIFCHSNNLFRLLER